MNNPGNDQQPPEPPPAGAAPPPPVEDPELTAPRECPDCRPGALDPLRCRAEGVKAEAAYDEQHKDGPNPDQYEAARLQYGQARHKAKPTVEKVDEDLARITNELRCLIDDSETVECLDDAWLEVEERLEVCAPQLGCCVDDEGDFDTDVSGCGIEIVKARIAEYEHRTEVAEACFTKLLAEPEALAKRVADLEAEVAGIMACPGGTAAAGQEGQTAATEPKKPADHKRQYAAALVARWHFEEVWWGFDHPHDYVDCLCRALRISLRGRAALSRLHGELAVRMCRQKARHDRCEHLRQHIVDGIIEEYVRRCHPRHRHHRDDDEHRHHRDDDWDDDDEENEDGRGRDRDERDRDRRRDRDRDRRRGWDERDRDRRGDRDHHDRDRDRRERERRETEWRRDRERERD